jgi:hypothetical protein
MKNLLLIIVLLISTMSFAQVNNIGSFNRAGLTQGNTMPWYNSGPAANIGIRTVWVADDLDNDGKQEVIATDYTNNGRVHVLELNGNALEIVWSSPIIDAHTAGSGSSPRWVRSGDLDGDGKGEIIFGVSQGAADYKLFVYEWDGINDNNYILATELGPAEFTALGITNVVRTNREVATVYDFDGDGSDELMVPNRDNRAYILGIAGDVPGFGTWQVEGGAPSVVPQKIGRGSIWHSIPADMNGDGNIEIINHMWNLWGFWSIQPNGTDSYLYPDTSNILHYHEWLDPVSVDAVAYMGIQRVDVDGDGKDEVFGIGYDAAGGERAFDPILMAKPQGADPLYSWSAANFGYIAANPWSLAGSPGGSIWGLGAADLNANGKEEVLLGGSNGYNIVSVEYNGTGDILNEANYTMSVLYAGDFTNRFSKLAIRDSAGVKDTISASGSESPFVSKMFSGSDINNNGKIEVVLGYQSVFDSISYEYRRWVDTAFVVDSTVKRFNTDQRTIKVIESTLSGIEVTNYPVISPDDYVLEQNYPNPFNPSTTIRFSLPVDKSIVLKVFDILGNEVKTLVNNDLKQGVYEVVWDGTTSSGQKAASGQYIYTLQYGNFSKSVKMTLLK